MWGLGGGGRGGVRLADNVEHENFLVRRGDVGGTLDGIG